MDDYISRNGTVEALCAMECGDDSEHCVKRTCEIFTTLMRLPSAPVREAKRGGWILNKAAANIDTYYFRCSECGNERCFIGAYKANWCEECGADMREDGDDV